MYDDSANQNNSLMTTTTTTTAAVSYAASASAANSDNNSMQFKYDDENIEVVIIDNGDDDRDGYVELIAAVKLLMPIVTIRGFNKAVLWTNTLPSQKLTRNNKNYVHVFALCKYLGLFNLSNSNRPHQYFVLKRLVSDLIVGAQSHIVDPINDIKLQLCSLQECLQQTAVGTNVIAKTAGSTTDQIYQPTTVSHAATNSTFSIDSWRDLLRNENSSLYANILTAIDGVKNLQLDLTNKLAFSNDTMLDNFKSIKDIIIRKK
ncbi:P24 [Trabala vishnou gigantina nucleopolyhedrovirus]|uniref:P24 n=1 Tax=Trabala vishnou gigantina nucleopolyhedrovirus TaxID=2863583 RepID=UPI002481EB39|nr:P24 [Trabala vishnou gigantina nucleopolyhedrovirus]QYC92721.1 P24 [Trabala vishnou gigantina nucleopolyhedrovirus]